MKRSMIRSVLLGVSALFVTLAMAGAGTLPPPGSKPLSAILQAVEGQALGVITSAEFDDGRWEVKVCQGSVCLELYIDPRSGAEQCRQPDKSDEALPPAHARPLSAIIQALEERQLGVITEVEFDDGFWEVKLRQDGRKLKLDIDPRTGESRR
jgi:hypothetical protein